MANIEATQGAPVDTGAPVNTENADNTQVSAVDAIAAALNSRAARIALAVMAAAVVVAGLIGAAAAVFDLQTRHMSMAYPVAVFNAALVAVMPVALALGAAQSIRERTRAALTFWLVVWAVTALSLAALAGVLNAAAIVADVTALTNIGRILAPLPGAMAVTTVAAVLPTLRGDDDAGALGGLWALVAKCVVVGFSSFGLLNMAAQAEGVRDAVYAVALATVVEVSFIALLTRQKRSTAANALLLVLALVLGLNSAESASIAFGFELPGALAWIPAAGRASVVLSGMMCVLAAVALTVKTDKTVKAQPVAVADWLAARVADARAIRDAIPAPTRPTLTSGGTAPGTRRGSVALAAAADDAAAELEDVQDVVDDGDTPGAEVAAGRAKSRRRGK